MKQFLLFPLFIIIIVTALSSCDIGTTVNLPKAKNGFLDLSNWDFHKDGNVKLDGEYEFYWNKLLEPKDFKITSLINKNYINVPLYVNIVASFFLKKIMLHLSYSYC